MKYGWDSIAIMIGKKLGGWPMGLTLLALSGCAATATISAQEQPAVADVEVIAVEPSMQAPPALVAKFRAPPVQFATLDSSENFVVAEDAGETPVADTDNVVDDETEPNQPLFVYWNQDLDPAFIPHRHTSVVRSGQPRIVGTLPGQRALPNTLYREAAAQTGPETSQVTVEHDLATGDLWERIRQGFSLDRSNPKIAPDLAWFARNQDYLTRVMLRAERYLHYVVEQVEARGVPSELVLLPIVESAYQPFAFSHGRAAGLWQFIPGTGRLYGLKQNWWYDGRRDIHASTDAAISLLSDLHEQFDYDWELALAGYNSGPGTVRKAIERNIALRKGTDFWSLKLPEETRGYVPKLLAIAEIIADPARYGIELTPIRDEPYIARIELPEQIDLALAAELADVNVEELYLLNPGMNRWATDPVGPHVLMLPIDKAEQFKANFAALPKDQLVHWERHVAIKGDTVTSVADRFATSADLVRFINQVSGNRLRAGQQLVIPLTSPQANRSTLSASLRQLRNEADEAPAEEPATHRVGRGETLASIARKYDLKLKALAKANGLSPKAKVRTGTELVVELQPPAPSASAEPAFSPLDRDLVVRKIGYKVRRGDSITKIAKRFSVNVADVRRWNNIKHSKGVRRGQPLTLFIDVTRTAG